MGIRRPVTTARLNPALARFGRQWTRGEDARLRLLWDGDSTVAQIALKLKRPVTSVYWRAQHLCLPLGVPEGREYLTTAAARAGFTVTQLRMILAWADVSIRRTLSRPTRRARGYHHVDPIDVDDAVVRWLATETLHAAATRHTLCDQTVADLLAARGITRPAALRGRLHWRVESHIVDEVVAAYRAAREVETLSRAALRHRVGRITLSKWLHRAGVIERPRSGGSRGVRLDPAVIDRVVAERRAVSPQARIGLRGAA